MAKPHHTPLHPTHIWQERFGARLMELHPTMSTVAAAQHAVDAHPEASELEPEVAAELFAAEPLSGASNAPD